LYLWKIVRQRQRLSTKEIKDTLLKFSREFKRNCNKKEVEQKFKNGLYFMDLIYKTYRVPVELRKVRKKWKIYKVPAPIMGIRKEKFMTKLLIQAIKTRTEQGLGLKIGKELTDILLKKGQLTKKIQMHHKEILVNRGLIKHGRGQLY
jgi:hypothetical protein